MTLIFNLFRRKSVKLLEDQIVGMQTQINNLQAALTFMSGDLRRLGQQTRTGQAELRQRLIELEPKEQPAVSYEFKVDMTPGASKTAFARSLRDTFAHTLTERAAAAAPVLPSHHPKVEEQRGRDLRFGVRIKETANHIGEVIRSALNSKQSDEYRPWRTIQDQYDNYMPPGFDHSKITIGMYRQRIMKVSDDAGVIPRAVRSRHRHLVSQWPERMHWRAMVQLMREAGAFIGVRH